MDKFYKAMAERIEGQRTDVPEHFCILPWINQEARTNGDIGVCCVMQETAPGLNLADGHTLKDAWNSDWLAKLKQDFLDGKKPPGKIYF